MSTTYNDTGEVTHLPDADVPKFSRVKRTPTGVAVAGAADRTYGSALRDGYAPTADIGQESISVKLANAPGTHFAIAAGTIPEGAEVQAAAGGKLALLAGGTAIGICEEPGGATEDGHVFEVMYY